MISAPMPTQAPSITPEEAATLGIPGAKSGSDLFQRRNHPA